MYAMVTMYWSNPHGRWDVSNHWQADRRISNVMSTICQCVFTQAWLNSLEQSNAAECPARVMNDIHSIVLPTSYSRRWMCVYVRVYQQSEDTRHGSQSSHTTDTELQPTSGLSHQAYKHHSSVTCHLLAAAVPFQHYTVTITKSWRQWVIQK